MTGGISYELAKELKDAGFSFVPFHEKDGLRTLPEGRIYVYGNGVSYIRFGKNGWRDGINSNPESVVCRLPFLTELLYACKPHLAFLSPSDAWDEWRAGSFNEETKQIQQGVGKTPEEAAIRLYIALKKV